LPHRLHVRGPGGELDSKVAACLGYEQGIVPGRVSPEAVVQVCAVQVHLQIGLEPTKGVEQGQRVGSPGDGHHQTTAPAGAGRQDGPRDLSLEPIGMSATGHG